jgi:Domain of unknown function (DUF4413)
MLKSFLGVFFTTTVKLSCSYTPSTHELLHHLYRISKVNYLFFNLIHFKLHFFNFSSFFLSHLFLYYFFFYLIFFYIIFSISFFLYFFSISSHLFLYSFSQKVYREMENIESLDCSLSPIVEAMKENFLKYWEEVPAVIIIANYLHPSFKKKIHRKTSSKVQTKSTSTH